MTLDEARDQIEEKFGRGLDSNYIDIASLDDIVLDGHGFSLDVLKEIVAILERVDEE